MAVNIIAHKTTSICPVYIPPNEQLTLQKLEDLTAQLPEPFVLVGDFNAHGTLWGSDKTDQIGQLIDDFILSNDICLLSSGTPTYFSPSSGKFSCLDLAFCSPSKFNDFEWEVLDSSYGSDHLPAIIKLPLLLPTITSEPRRWLIHLVDWPLFSENAKLEDAISPDMAIDDINNKITDTMIKAAEKTDTMIIKSCPK